MVRLRSSRAICSAVSLCLLLLAGVPRSKAQQQKSASSFATLSARADAARDADRLDEAASLYLKALAIKPGWAEGWWSLGTIDYDRNQFRDAAQAFDKLVALQPKSGTARVMLGLCQFELGQDEAALESLQEGRRLGISTDPQFREVMLYHEGVLLQRAGRFEAAEEILGQMCRKEPYPPQVNLTMGAVALRVRDRQWPAAGTPDYQVMQKTGEATCLAAQRKYDEGRQQFDALLAGNPQYPNLHYAYGKFLLDANDNDAAVAQFQAEITRNPNATLLEYADRPLKIGSFSAASNVTGIVSNTVAIAEILHEQGALSFWDFAAAAPYIDIEMHPGGPEGGPEGSTAHPAAYKDAIFLSPHKFIGGPSTPGVLVARRELFANRVPEVPGGGTVAYVNDADHAYLPDPTHREEGGTPAIIESVRAGLVFQLKQAVGVDTIRAAEKRFLSRAVAAWSAEPAIEILGNVYAERLSIVSFVVRAPSGRYLHHNFVVAVLNDLFGIQSRGGCSCAGPYGHRLLGIDIERSHEFEREITGGCEGIKPGWVRVNFNYFLSDTVADYIIDAVRLVARDGWRLLGDYRFDPATGIWIHRDGLVEPPLRLGDVTYDEHGMHPPSAQRAADESVLGKQLEDGARILAAAHEPDLTGTPSVSHDFEHLRWFDLPSSALTP